MKVRIWCPEAEDEEDAKIVEVASANHLDLAVESYAKKDWADSDYWESSEFCVQVVGEEKRRYFLVRAEQTVDFNARELKKEGA